MILLDPTLDFEYLLSKNSTVLLVYGADVEECSSVARNAITLVRHYSPTAAIYDVSRNRTLRHKAASISGWELFPQLFVHGQFIGGRFILDEFFESGEYNRIITQHSDQLDKQSSPNCAPSHQLTLSSAIWRFYYHDPADLLAAASANGCITLSYPKLRSDPKQLSLGKRWVNSIVIDSQATYLYAALTDTSIRVIDLRTGTESSQFTYHNRWVNDLAISKNEKILWSVSADGILAGLDLTTQQVTQRIQAHNNCVWCVEVSGCGRFVVTGSSDGQVRYWSTQNLELIADIQAHSSTVTSLTKWGDSMLSTSYDCTIRRHDDSSSSQVCFSGHQERIWATSRVGSTNDFLSVSGDGTVRLWNAINGQQKECISFKSMPIAIQYTPSTNEYFVGHSNGSVTRKTLPAT